MNSAYVPDNTRSSMVIVLSLALAVGLIAALVGLSDKPDVQVLAVSTDRAVAANAPIGAAEATSLDESPALLEFDELGDPILDDDTSSDAAAEEQASAGPEPAAAITEAASATAEAIASAPIAIPTSTPEPEPTPEVAAAVEPTPMPSAEPTAEPGADTPDSNGTGGGTIEAGSAEGAFFTRPDEDAGALIGQNRVEVSFNPDGSGSFTGVLDITYTDDTHVYLDMSGPLVWTSDNPQVTATVTGDYGFDATIDADDFASQEGELSITSLESGSGSLCTPKCFGFTFPQQGQP